jgi:hypothetical protein
MRIQLSLGPEILSTSVVTLEINDFQKQVRMNRIEAQRGEEPMWLEQREGRGGEGD